MQGSRLTAMFSSSKKSPRRGPLSPLTQPIAFVLPKSPGDDEPFTPPPLTLSSSSHTCEESFVDGAPTVPPKPSAVVLSPLSSMEGSHPVHEDRNQQHSLAPLSGGDSSTGKPPNLMIEPVDHTAAHNYSSGEGKASAVAPDEDASLLASFFNGVPSWASPTTPTFKPAKIPAKNGSAVLPKTPSTSADPETTPPAVTTIATTAADDVAPPFSPLQPVESLHGCCRHGGKRYEVPTSEKGAAVACSTCHRNLPKGDSFLGCKVCQVVSCNACCSQPLSSEASGTEAPAASAGNHTTEDSAAAAARAATQDKSSRKVVETRPSWPPHRAVSPSPSSVFSPPGLSPSSSLARGSSAQSASPEDAGGGAATDFSPASSSSSSPSSSSSYITSMGFRSPFSFASNPSATTAAVSADTPIADAPPPPPTLAPTAHALTTDDDDDRDAPNVSPKSSSSRGSSTCSSSSPRLGRRPPPVVTTSSPSPPSASASRTRTPALKASSSAGAAAAAAADGADAGTTAASSTKNATTSTATKSRVRCRVCGCKVAANEATKHVCDLGAVYSRCTHCGEQVPLEDAGSHFCAEAVAGIREPTTPEKLQGATSMRKPGLQLGDEEVNVYRDNGNNGSRSHSGSSHSHSGSTSSRYSDSQSGLLKPSMLASWLAQQPVEEMESPVTTPPQPLPEGEAEDNYVDGDEDDRGDEEEGGRENSNFDNHQSNGDNDDDDDVEDENLISRSRLRRPSTGAENRALQLAADENCPEFADAWIDPSAPISGYASEPLPTQPSFEPAASTSRTQDHSSKRSSFGEGASALMTSSAAASAAAASSAATSAAASASSAASAAASVASSMTSSANSMMMTSPMSTVAGSMAAFSSTAAAAADSATTAGAYGTLVEEDGESLAKRSAASKEDAAATAAAVAAQRLKAVADGWQCTLGYSLSSDRSSGSTISNVLVPGHPVPFESDLLEGHFYLALKQDKGMDSHTYQNFFHNKARTCQLQWSIRLKRKLNGPLFIGFESNLTHQRGALPRSMLQSSLTNLLTTFHAKKDLHLALPASQKTNVINEDNDWGLAVNGRKSLGHCICTPVGCDPPRLSRPLEDQFDQHPPMSSIGNSSSSSGGGDGRSGNSSSSTATTPTPLARSSSLGFSGFSSPFGRSSSTGSTSSTGGGGAVPGAGSFLWEDLEVGPTYSFSWYTQYLEFASLSLVNVPMVGSYPLPVSVLRLVLYEDAPPPTTTTPSASSSSSSATAAAPTSTPAPPPSSSFSTSMLSPLPSPPSFFSPSTTTPAAGTSHAGSNSDAIPTPLTPQPPLPLSTTSIQHMVGTRQYLTGKAKVREGASKSSTKVGDIANGKVVLVLQVGIDPLDGTPRALVRGSGVPAEATELARRSSITRSTSSNIQHDNDNDDDGSRSRSHSSSSLRRSVSDASTSAGAADVSDPKAKKKKKVVVELEGWLSAALLLPPGAAADARPAGAPSALNSGHALLGSTRHSTNKVESSQLAGSEAVPEAAASLSSDPSLPSAPSSAVPPLGRVPLPSQANRTYAFSCVFAMQQSEASS